ncbi:MAG: DUF1501 domain-containing protein [Bdellovibrionaceae bacterium]|nr:DUF1501 domain-containing protein [Bdellovibrionales bacterium]MCB9085919.1 DUF1501 domain-containing protein [Pseudobdellovibrionaceae bacterium]
MFPIFSWPGQAYGKNKEFKSHFFLQVFFEGGWDSSYLFDARSLKMTQENLIQNYVNEEPFVWEAAGGRRTLASPLVRPLKKFRRDLTIIKGVNTLPNFDGHPHNLRYYFSGKPLSSGCFLEGLGKRVQGYPLDYVQIGKPVGVASLGNKGLNVDPSEIGVLHDAVGLVPESLDGPSAQYLRNQYAANAGEASEFQRGQRDLLAALDGQESLVRAMKKVNLAADNIDIRQRGLGVVKSYFQAGVCQGAIIIYGRDRFDLDSHSDVLAKGQPAQYKKLVAEIDEILSYLKRTAFDNRKSMLDVTTVSFGSEFGRSMKVSGARVDSSGTNHNTFNNMILLAGRGIKGGQIVGETDYHSGSEVLSPAHLGRDPDKVKVMGKPYDFTAQRVIDRPLEVYKSGDYITMASILNTIYHLLDVDKKRYWALPDDRKAIAPILKSVLS